MSKKTKPSGDSRAPMMLAGKPTEAGIYAVAGFHIGHPEDHAIVEVIDHAGELLVNLHERNSERHSWDYLSDCSDRFKWWRISGPFVESLKRGAA